MTSETQAFRRFVTAIAAALAHLVCSAQLVSDGASNILDGVATNLTGDVIIGTNGPFTFLVLTNIATVTNTDGVTIGQNSGAKSNALSVVGAGSVWSASGGFAVGSGGGFNALNILDGGVVTNQYGHIGTAANSNTVVVSGTNSFWNMQWTSSGLYGSLRVGSSGAGNLLVITNGGKVADGFAYIGENTTGAGNTVIVSGAGSVWSHLAPVYYVGYNGSGNALLISNGGAVTGGLANLGFQGNSNSVVVTGTNSSWSTSRLSLGNAGNSAFNEVQVNEGGLLSVASFTTIGQYTSSNLVRTTGPGTLWTNASYLDVGYGGRGNQLIVSNGAVVNVDYTHVAANGGSQEKVIITGTGSLLTNRSDFFLGHAGPSNQLLVANGGRLANNIGYIGYGGFNAISNMAMITDTNSIWTNRGNLYIGYNDARSQLLISNGARVFNDNGILGPNSSGTNFVLVSGYGSLWSNRSDVTIGNTASANQLMVSDGGTVKARNLTLGASSTSTNNLLTVTGGSVIVSNFSNGTLSSQRGTITLNSGLVQADLLQLNSGVAGKLVFNGGTLLVRSASFANTAPLTVGDGANAAAYVLANTQFGTGTHSFNNGLIISSNATLTGPGTINGNVFIRDGGTFAPGTSNILFLSLNGSLVLSNACTNAIQLNAQSGYCRHVEGVTDVTLGGTLQLTNLAGSLASGMSFRLFYTTNCHGAYTAITPPTPGVGLKWNTNQLNADGTLRIFSASTPPPMIVSADRSDTNLLMLATGGISYDPCYVLTSTNLIDWEFLATNVFDAAGTVTITRPILLTEPARFYHLQVE